MGRGFLICRRCGSSYVNRTAKWPWYGWPLALLGLAPFRCIDCGRRTWRLRWVRTQEPRSK